MSTQPQECPQMYDGDGNVNYLWQDQQTTQQPQPLYDGDGNNNYLHQDQLSS